MGTSTKLEKSLIPGNGTREDFRCFGPVADEDGKFESVMLADLGCFKQGEVDSNKYYHGAVVQCISTGRWYAYFEWGRQGNTSKPQFLFVECASKEAAQQVFAKQMHSKNDKRGRMVIVGGVATLEAKPGKDVYLVRNQAVRTTGLPDAKNITSEVFAASKPLKNGKKISVSRDVASLLSDLNVGTVAFTRASMSNNDLPTLKAISEARDLLQAARIRLSNLDHKIETQINDRELILLTNTLYSRVPKKKPRGLPPEKWLLNENNIDLWLLDLDAFASAVGAMECETTHNPYGDLPIELAYLGNAQKPQTDMAKWICNWMPNATRNVHSYLGNLRILGIWEIHRKDGLDDFSDIQKTIQETAGTISERPLFQKAIKDRPDLSPSQKKLWWETNTSLLFHGTRSVNVRGILHSTLKLPNQLVGVQTTAAMFGQGIYNADDFKKSTGYTSHPRAVYTRNGSGAVSGRKAFIFLNDVVLGKSHVAEEPEGFTSPPRGYHSVFGKGGVTIIDRWEKRRLLNNEFIVYKSRQNVLRYLVEFEAPK